MVDVKEVPDFNTMYELYDPVTVRTPLSEDQRGVHECRSGHQSASMLCTSLHSHQVC